MAKIMKYCSSCDEGFAEKFAFCPDCGAALQSYEMNPLSAGEGPAAEFAAAPVPSEVTEPVETRSEVMETRPQIEPEVAPEVAEAAPAESVEEVVEAATNTEPIAAVSEPAITPVETMDAVETETAESIKVPATAAAAAPATSFFQTKPMDADRMPRSLEAEHQAYAADGGFYVTVIEEKNVKQRNTLLLGVLALTVLFWSTMVVGSIFSKDLDIGSINDDVFNAVLVDDIPMDVDPEKQIKDKKDAGGGGGGGRQDKEETTRGDLADQSPHPTRPPDANTPRMENPSLVLPPPQTQGNQVYDKKYNKWGDPNGRFDSFSNGTGSGGGQGSGYGTGQGSGRGTGNGSGNGSGSGGGLGSGNGNGTGAGDDTGNPPPVLKVGVTQAVKIISKPRPGYTDSARQANIQGTVILRVTFLGSGQIGSISAVKGLGSGLTEQAIAAARRISFEPAKVNGVGQTVTKQVEYTFSIY